MLLASMKAKIFDKDGEEVLVLCEKHSNDSVELAGLCKLLFFYSCRCLLFVLLLRYSSDCRLYYCVNQEKQFPCM